MTVGIGAAGYVGVAVETVANTYTPPTLFVPVMSESLSYAQETQWRRPIRQTASITGAVDGDVRVEGDISMEAFGPVLPLLLQAARTSVTKLPATPATPPYTYEFIPTDDAVAAKTLSITVARNGEIFGYTGCVLGSFTFTVDAGRLMFNCTVLGSDEAEETAPTPTWDDMDVFGAGMYSIEIPTASQVFDADGFDFQVENNAEAQYRLKNTGRGAQFIKYGENNVTLAMERDFHNRDEYDAFKALTEQSITLKADNGSDSVELLIPVAIKSEYTIGLSGQGDLIRAATSYNGVLDSEGKPYSITVGTDADLVVA